MAVLGIRHDVRLERLSLLSLRVDLHVTLHHVSPNMERHDSPSSPVALPGYSSSTCIFGVPFQYLSPN